MATKQELLQQAEREYDGLKAASKGGSRRDERARGRRPGGEGTRERSGTSTRRCRRPSSPDPCAGERSAICDNTNSRAPSIVSSQPRRGVPCSR